MSLFAKTKKGVSSSNDDKRANNGFGLNCSKPSKKKVESARRTTIKKNRILSEPETSTTVRKAYVKSEQETLLRSLASRSLQTPIGQAVASSPFYGTSRMDPFWELLPSLIVAKFPHFSNDDLIRVAGFVRHAVHAPNNLGMLDDNILQDMYRPQEDIHAYMPGLGDTASFLDPDELQLCHELCHNINIITEEYNALVSDMKAHPNTNNKFQSVTSMNYESGWKTLVLFYNGHRLPSFPYHLCPTTVRLLESVPLAGRIAGFNRQAPHTGIPPHSDGNNMWLTCQMGISVPPNAYITVGNETRHWKRGECLVYDTTYTHSTWNGGDEERVVLHVDFFNILKMTKMEVDVMRYIYKLREEFMKAEGVGKVGAQIL